MDGFRRGRLAPTGTVRKHTVGIGAKDIEHSALGGRLRNGVARVVLPVLNEDSRGLRALRVVIALALTPTAAGTQEPIRTLP